jgi:hypothetical protein
MAQRRSQASLMEDLAHIVEKQALQLVSHPQSPNGVHTTPEELLHLQTIRTFIRVAKNKVKGEEVGMSAIHNGLDAPRTRRLIREYYRDEIDTGSWDDTDEGMRR